jgi:signal transduction histidine kinase
LTLSIPPKVPRICGDKHRLAVLLNNLIGNAVKYTPDGGRVEVILEAGESWVQVSVKDTGLGISDEDQKHVFEKFYRSGDDDVQQIKGTGLGLAIAREVARLHGGDITLQSEVGAGSTFTVELPTNADKNNSGAV